MHVKLLSLALFATVCVTSVTTSSAANTIRVPEDRRTIQRGIDAAGPGDMVLVSPGTYPERIQMKAGVTLKSDGDDTPGVLGLKRAEATIIDGGGELLDGAGVTMAPGSTIDGFTVTNVGSHDDALWKKHHATQGAQQSHEFIGQPGAAGIAVTGVTCAIRNNIVHHIGHTGIEIYGVEGKQCSPHIYRNICYRNMGGGIGSLRRSTAIIEENISFQNFYAGIGHHGASPTVIKNTCYENIRAGIGISEGACPIVRGNKCYKNRRAGIGARSGADTRPIIEDNDCYENDMAGIGTAAEASPIIHNNRCYKNKLAGIGSRQRARPTIIGNACYENEKAGIGQESDAVTELIDNYCHHNKAAGIGFAACQAGRSTVVNNRIIDNALVAVGINAGWTVQLSGNELSRADGLPPIVMVFDGAEVTLASNVIRGRGVAGLRVAGKVRADNNEFVGTLRTDGPPNFAIWALPGSDVTMTGNRIHGWRHALHASGASVSAIQNTVSSFAKTAFVIREPSEPANVYGNTAIAKDSNCKVVSISGETGVVHDNHLAPPNE